MVRVYGYSDDIVCIEGSKYKENEIDCYDKDIEIEFTDGTIINIGYGKNDLAIWYICVKKYGSASYNHIVCEDENSEIYSDIFEIESEIKYHKIVNKW